MPLMMLLAAYDTDASANGIKLMQSQVAPHFNCLVLRNAIVTFMVLGRPHDAATNAMALHDSNTNWHHMTKIMLHLISIV